MKIVKAILLIFLISLPVSLFSTTQISEKIIYKGKEYILYTTPLEPYFENYPNKRPITQIINTALVRGYQATYEIIGNKLYVKDIEVYYSANKRNQLNSVFRDIFPGISNVNADWFSGWLILPYGEIVNCLVPVGSQPEHSNYLIFKIEKGKVIEELDLNTEEYNIFKKQELNASNYLLI